MEPIIIRASTLPGYNDCPRRAAIRAWPRLLSAAGFNFADGPRKIYTAIGNGCHAGAAVLSNQKKDRKSPDVAEGYDVAIQLCRTESVKGIEYDDVTANMNAAEKQIVRMIGLFNTSVLPSLDPVAVEIKRPATINDQFGLSGTADMETAKGIIFDWKFGAVWRSCKAQLGAYSILRTAHGQGLAAGLCGCHIPRTSIRKDQPPAELTEYRCAQAEAMAQELIKIIMRDITAFLKSGNPAAFPCNPMSKLCSNKFCIGYNSDWCRAAA